MCRWPPTPQALAYAAPGNAPQLVRWTCIWASITAPISMPSFAIAGVSSRPSSCSPQGDSTLRRQAAERGWGFLAKPVRPPALRALMSQTFARLRKTGVKTASSPIPESACSYQKSSDALRRSHLVIVF